MHASTNSYWDAVKHILRYLQGTTTYDLHITHSYSFVLHGFTNANWTGNVDDCKSMNDYLVFFVTKYVEVDYYFIQDMVTKKKKIQIRFIFFEHQLTDIFTKPIYSF
jgi:hypothetical protein